MTFAILGANSAVGGYAIDNSLRFNDDDSPILSYTPSSTATDRKKSTISFWFKIGNVTNSFRSLYRFNDGTDTGAIYLRSGNNLQFAWNTSTTDLDLNLTAIQRDVSAWYHFFVNYDTTQATASDRVNIYINGVKQTAFGTETYPNLNDTVNHLTNGETYYIGGDGQSSDKYWDGYIAEFHAIDGQTKEHTDFGEFDEDSGIWKPIEYTGSYGTNGFYLDFENSGSLGADQSGNGNNFTATNLASTDQTTDTCTNNFCTLNPLYKQGSPTFSEGNCKVVLPAGDGTQGAAGGIAPANGKWYWEVKHVSSTNSSILVREASDKEDDLSYYQGSYAGYEKNDGNQRVTGNTESTYGASYTSGDIIMIALDMDNNRVYFGKNGLWNDGDGNADESNLSDFVPLNGVDNGVPAVANANGSATATFEFNFGNPAFSISSGNSDGKGYGNFEYVPPSGYLALCTQNLATALSPTIDDGSQYFSTVTYSGTGATRSITGLGFSPDWTWIKERNNAVSHRLFDSVRGATKRMFSNNTDAESTATNSLTSFDSDGFSLGDSGSVNGGSDTYVAWNWRGSDSSAVSNTDGSITSTVSANTTAGFSIVSYTGTGSNATIGHGLGVVPKMYIVKNRNATQPWWTFHTELGGEGNLRLNDTGTDYSDSSVWNDTAPTSSVFSVGTNTGSNGSGNSIIAYCFAEIEGYSKFGSYTGNGSTDGAYIHLGFTPSFVMTKRTNSANQWTIFDSGRDPFNVVGNQLAPNTNNAEEADASHSSERDFLSNGFKMRAGGNDTNASGGTYIYMAFAKNPFVDSNGVPVTAR